MLATIKNIWPLFKSFLSFISEILGLLDEALTETNIQLDKLNDELSLKSNLSKLKLWDVSISGLRQKTPINCVYTIQFFDEMLIFIGQSRVLLEYIIKNPKNHKECVLQIKAFEQEMQALKKSPEFLEIIKFCKSAGLIEVKDLRKVLEFYVGEKSFKELEDEAANAKSALKQTQKANSLVKRLVEKLAITPPKIKAEKVITPPKIKAEKAIISQPKSQIELLIEDNHKPIITNNGNTLPQKSIHKPIEKKIERPLTECVYITKANESNIISNLDLKGSKEDFECLYDRSISFILSTPELRLLFLYKELCSHPQDAFSAFKKTKKTDTKTYVWEGTARAYHFKNNCSRLTAEFTNLTIPPEIQVKGNILIEKYRVFVKDNKELLVQNESRFLDKLEAQFLLKNRPQKVSFENSGVYEFTNYDLKKLKSEIDDLILSAEKHMNRDEETYKEIKAKGFGTHKIDEAKISGHPLYIWHNYKLNLKSLLRNYYRVRFNPEMKFEKSSLDQIGLQPCSTCKP
ncbi:MAG: hypothetical protein ACJASR_001040 [Psychroserpens sp.]|jgi:hypothetical protein